MRAFKLVRTEDVSGVSGTGTVAEGVEFHDGQCVMSWFGQHHTLEISPTIDSIITIHGHDGKTKVVWAEADCHSCGEPILTGEECAVYCMMCNGRYNEHD